MLDPREWNLHPRELEHTGEWCINSASMLSLEVCKTLLFLFDISRMLTD